MKNICVIGNSHVAALKHGYLSLVNRSNQLVFWCLPGGGGPNLQIDSQNRIVISPEVEKELKTDISPYPGTTLDLSSYDAIVLSGIGMPAIRRGRNNHFKNYLPAGFVQDNATDDRQILSRSVFEKLIESALRANPSFQNIEKISRIFQRKIYLQMFPLPTQSNLDQVELDLPLGNRTGKFLSWYFRQQLKVVADQICDHSNIEILNYPSHWIEEGFSPPEFQSEDPWHLNYTFGRYLLEPLACGKTTATAAA